MGDSQAILSLKSTPQDGRWLLKASSLDSQAQSTFYFLFTLTCPAQYPAGEELHAAGGGYRMKCLGSQVRASWSSLLPMSSYVIGASFMPSQPLWFYMAMVMTWLEDWVPVDSTVLGLPVEGTATLTSLYMSPNALLKLLVLPKGVYINPPSTIPRAIWNYENFLYKLLRISAWWCQCL